MIGQADNFLVLWIVLRCSLAAKEHFEIAHAGGGRVIDALDQRFVHILSKPLQLGFCILGQRRSRQHGRQQFAGKGLAGVRIVGYALLKSSVELIDFTICCLKISTKPHDIFRKRLSVQLHIPEVARHICFRKLFDCRSSSSKRHKAKANTTGRGQQIADQPESAARKQQTRASGGDNAHAGNQRIKRAFVHIG